MFLYTHTDHVKQLQCLYFVCCFSFDLFLVDIKKVPDQMNLPFLDWKPIHNNVDLDKMQENMACHHSLYCSLRGRNTI